MAHITRHPDREAALEMVLAELLAAVDAALAADPAGRPLLCLSGGSSPVPLYRRLGQAPLAFERVDLCPSDERWVPTDTAQSNEGMLRREMLSGPAASAVLHGLYREGMTVDEAAPQVAADFAARLDRPFDYCLLGMGADGHTASLFPDAAHLDALLASSAPVAAAHVAHLTTPRITLTPQRLCRSRRIALLLFGEDKLEVLERAVAPGPVAELPVRCVLHQQVVPVTCHWAP